MSCNDHYVHAVIVAGHLFARGQSTLSNEAVHDTSPCQAYYQSMAWVQVGWWWRWMPAPGEAWELMKFSSLKTLRALQTLAKLASELGSSISKHRYTSSLLLQVQLRCL